MFITMTCISQKFSGGDINQKNDSIVYRGGSNYRGMSCVTLNIWLYVCVCLMSCLPFRSCVLLFCLCFYLLSLYICFSVFWLYTIVLFILLLSLYTLSLLTYKAVNLQILCIEKWLVNMSKTGDLKTLMESAASVNVNFM